MVTLLIAFAGMVLVLFPLWALIRILALGRENEALAARLSEVEQALRKHPVSFRAVPAPSIATSLPLTPPGAVPSIAPVVLPPPLAATPAPPGPLPPPLPPPFVSDFPAPAVVAAPPDRAPGMPSAVPPALPPAVPASPPRPYTPPPPRAINWEQFMGAKLFAWLGGLAAFLGAAFFVKYSFDHDLIPPAARVALGYLFSLGLIGAGLKLARSRYAITAQTLCATGIVSLYAVTFACDSIYHFAFFGPVATFAVMALVTAAAFFLAVRLEARVVAILGLLGGFLTPILLSSGRDNPVGLFGYVALLDLGLIAVALHRRWHFLTALGAAGTVLMQLGWAGNFLRASKAPTAMVICLSFCVLWLAAYFIARWRGGRRAPPGSAGLELVSSYLTYSAITFPLVALGFAALFLSYPAIAARPGLLFGFALAADVCLLALAWREEALPKLHLVGGLILFALLAAWTSNRLTHELLPWALGLYLIHAVLHTAFPLLLERHRPSAPPAAWSQLFPPLTLLLLLGPLFKLDGLSFAFWPCVLAIDLLAIGLAFLTASVASVVVVLVLTLAATAVWIVRLPTALPAPGVVLLMTGGFAALFFAAGLLLSRAPAAGRTSADPRGQLPMFSALLPFVLLMLMTLRLPFASPSPIFALALALTIMVLGLTTALRLNWLPACALAGVAAVEYTWRSRHPSLAETPLVLAWQLTFYGAFTVYPFLFRRRLAALTGPWATAALAGLVQFPLVYQLIKHTRPNDFMGLLPALFAAAPLASLLALHRTPPTDARARLDQRAWFGGAALLFITLIFPIQFERQWITLSWALEGAALLWLYHRVPHPALRTVGVTLLVVAFARLALNPAVLAYHPRGASPILNWYLYSYGVVIAALFAGMRQLGASHATPSPAAPLRILGLPARALLGTLGTILAFLLLNVEIADFFAAPGARVLTFEFSGNFGRDMSYTIGWALFALGLLLVSFGQKLPAGRYAAITLLAVALLKLFFHDLARLEALYRIGALFALAVIAIVASFAYQRFLPGDTKGDAPR